MLSGVDIKNAYNRGLKLKLIHGPNETPIKDVDVRIAKT